MILFEENVAVHCETEEQARIFLEVCRDNGIRWSGIGIITKTMWKIYRDQTCYTLSNFGLKFGYVDFFNSENYRVVRFNEFMGEEI